MENSVMTDCNKPDNKISKHVHFQLSDESEVDQSYHESVKDDEIHAPLFDEILKNSAIFIISKIGRAQSKFHKLLWLLILVLSLSACGFQINRFLHLYFQYPVLLNLEVERKMHLDFPAVTICNVNGIKRQNEEYVSRKVSSESYKVISKELTFSVTIDKNFTNMNNNSGEMTQESDNFLNYNDSIKDYLKEDNRQSKIFIMNCFFNGEYCYENSFYQTSSPNYGDCFTFNKVTNVEEKPLLVSKSGLYSGLEILLDAENGKYSFSSGTIGFRIVIHDPSENPDPEERGFSISPGFETSASMRQTLIHRLPPPYKDQCAYYNVGERSNQTNQNDCQRLCFQKRTREICGCKDSNLDTEENLLKCDQKNSSQLHCLDDILEFIPIRTTLCDCPLPCISKSYNEVLSQGVLSINGLQERESSIYPFQGKVEFQKRYAKLKVFYSTLETTVFMQKPMFEDSEIFSHLGGELGLWLGLSLVALFELIWNLMRVIKFVIRS
ncbi:acid-sensing ion channel 1 [Trichonephila inaurata madagascariensis]|uniref:Acid-sensing ion channel 1 n=1 Tax=Trichonephila inaurata madagascariensis TaxID=2747483 RepID=A0A8X6X0E8_9ARAC|nr:acid-sensing ion channel 1 [Trichonephila inaurata madagascariensis]